METSSAAAADGSDLSSADEAEIIDSTETSSTSASWHPVWKSFKKFVDSNGKEKLKCMELKPNGKQCGAVLVGRYTTPAMRHLQSFHSKIHVARVRELKSKQKEPSLKRKDHGEPIAGQQPLLIARTSAKYSSNHPKQRIITRKWAKAFVGNSLASRLIENEDFRDALESMDEKYDPPSRYLLQKEENLMFDAMKKSILKMLGDASRIAITADIWTKRGGTESFFGVTAHWYNKMSHRLMTATLAIQNLHGTHDAKSIYDHTCNISQSWSIPLEKVSKVVTDNGSNMVKAFQEEFQLVNIQEAEQFGNDGEDLDHLVNDPALIDANLEESMNDSDIDLEIMEFNMAEDDIGLAFNQLRRLSCFAHALQCCVRNFDKSTFAANSRKVASQLMNSFSHSPKATQLLVEKTGKKLLTACKTRWSYNCVAFERLLKLRTAITEITDQLQIDNLTNTQWGDLERYVKFTKPFANVTYCIEGNHYPTISGVIPDLLSLLNHLNQMRHVNGYMVASDTLLAEFQQRFAYILDSNNPKFEPVYVVATSLDPRYRLVLDEVQTNAAKREIAKLLNQNMEQGERGEDHQNEQPGEEQDDDYITALIRQRQQAHQVQEQLRRNPAGEEIESYFGSNHVLHRTKDPLGFWKDHMVAYPRLALVAQDILSIPATSAPVERLFSQASIAIAGRRNRLSRDQLQKEVMLKTNKSFL